MQLKHTISSLLLASGASIVLLASLGLALEVSSVVDQPTIPVPVAPVVGQDLPVVQRAPLTPPRSRYQEPYPSREGDKPAYARPNRLSDMLQVNVAPFYDMIKDGNSLGINVLSGLVKVERGHEAERSGLSGPRPLSVRVFGIPVFERGTRIRPVDDRPREDPLPPADFGGEEPTAEEP